MGLVWICIAIITLYVCVTIKPLNLEQHILEKLTVVLQAMGCNTIQMLESVISVLSDVFCDALFYF